MESLHENNNTQNTDHWPILRLLNATSKSEVNVTGEIKIVLIFSFILLILSQNLYISFLFTIGIKHCFSCINVCQVRREVLKTEAEGRGSQHLPRDLAKRLCIGKQCLIAVIA